MLRYLAMSAAIAMVSESSIAAELVANSDLIGTWKIAPSTFTIRELATPNSFPRPQLPTNHCDFALILKKDGSFLATNVPDKIFFGWPATAERSGKWSVSTNFYIGIPRPSTNTYSDFSLWFSKPSYGYWAHPITWFEKDAASPLKPALRLGPCKDKSNTYEWSVLITKQNGLESAKESVDEAQAKWALANAKATSNQPSTGESGASRTANGR